MTPLLNPNGKRPTHSIDRNHTHLNPDHHHQHQPLHHHPRIPLDPLINNAIKRPRTQLIQSQDSQGLSLLPSPNTTTTIIKPSSTTTTNHHHTHSITNLNTSTNSNSTFINPITHQLKNHNSNINPELIQRSTIKKTLSGLIFPHQNQSNTPLDLLNPTTTSHPSPTLRKFSQPQRSQPQAHDHHLHHSNQINRDQHPHTLDPKDSRSNLRERSRTKDKDELKREMAQWQEKYRLAIKSFVFYLDRLDQQTTIDLTTSIRSWGARVDQFFSKDVTHIITDQPVPTNIPGPSPSPRKRSSAYQLPSPSRNKENGQLVVGSRRNSKRLCGYSPEKEFSTDSTPSIHPLIRKALELKIKIWKTEKLLNVLYRLGDQRSLKQTPPIKPSLPSLLLKEAQQGHTNEFDPVAMRSDYYYFGPKAMFIMVEDAIQEYKPIIVKEYTRPKTREVTSWPVMWGGAEGKSAFSRNTAKQSHLQVRNRIRQMFEFQAKIMAQNPIQSTKPGVHRERSRSLDDELLPSRLIEPPKPQQNLRRAVSMNILQRRQSARLARHSTLNNNTGEPIEPEVEDEECREIDHVNKTTPDHYRGPGNVFLAASGNSVSVTSNMASATSTRSSALRTAQVGRQLVDKRLAALGKRPTFEINNQVSHSVIGSSSLKREVGASTGCSKDRLQPLKKEVDSNVKKPGNLKRCQSLDSSLIQKRKALVSQKLGSVHVKRGLGVRAKLGNGFELIDLRKLARNEEPKAGYCENCRTKYPDFRKHILSRKHRKFALDDGNWADLDYMLKKTTRKLKPNVEVPPSVREMIFLYHENSDEDDEDQDEEDEVQEDEEEEYGEGYAEDVGYDEEEVVEDEDKEVNDDGDDDTDDDDDDDDDDEGFEDEEGMVEHQQEFEEDDGVEEPRGLDETIIVHDAEKDERIQAAKSKLVRALSGQQPCNLLANEDVRLDKPIDEQNLPINHQSINSKADVRHSNSPPPSSTHEFSEPNDTSSRVQRIFRMGSISPKIKPMSVKRCPGPLELKWRAYVKEHGLAQVKPGKEPACGQPEGCQVEDEGERRECLEPVSVRVNGPDVIEIAKEARELGHGRPGWVEVNVNETTVESSIHGDHENVKELEEGEFDEAVGEGEAEDEDQITPSHECEVNRDELEEGECEEEEGQYLEAGQEESEWVPHYHPPKSSQHEFDGPKTSNGEGMMRLENCRNPYYPSNPSHDHRQRAQHPNHYQRHHHRHLPPNRSRPNPHQRHRLLEQDHQYRHHNSTSHYVGSSIVRNRKAEDRADSSAGSIHPQRPPNDSSSFSYLNLPVSVSSSSSSSIHIIPACNRNPNLSLHQPYVIHPSRRRIVNPAWRIN